MSIGRDIARARSVKIRHDERMRNIFVLSVVVLISLSELIAGASAMSIPPQLAQLSIPVSQFLNSFFHQAGSIVTTSNGQLCNLQTSGAFLALPLYGYYSCQQSPTNPQYKYVNSATYTSGTQSCGFLGTSQCPIYTWEVHCPATGDLTNGCIVNVAASNFAATGFFGIANTISYNYKYCSDITNQCSSYNPAGIGAGQSNPYSLKSVSAAGSTDWTYLVVTSVAPMYNGAPLNLQDPNSIVYITVQEQYYSYNIYQFDLGAAPLQITSSGCNIPTTTPNLPCVSCPSISSAISGLTQGSLNTITPVNNPVNSLAAGQTSTYVKAWIPTLIPSTTYSYNGQNVGCLNKQVYSLQSLNAGGGCYAIPSNPIASVACCPGETFGSQVCGNDFNWNITNLGCVVGGIASTANCPQQLLGTTLKIATGCDQTSGNCIYQSYSLACNPQTNQGCSGGQICDISGGYQNAVCKGATNIYVGNTTTIGDPAGTFNWGLGAELLVFIGVAVLISLGMTRRIPLNLSIFLSLLLLFVFVWIFYAAYIIISIIAIIAAIILLLIFAPALLFRAVAFSRVIR